MQNVFTWVVESFLNGEGILGFILPVINRALFWADEFNQVLPPVVPPSVSSWDLMGLRKMLINADIFISKSEESIVEDGSCLTILILRAFPVWVLTAISISSFNDFFSLWAQFFVHIIQIESILSSHVPGFNEDSIKQFFTVCEVCHISEGDSSWALSVVTVHAHRSSIFTTFLEGWPLSFFQSCLGEFFSAHFE